HQPSISRPKTYSPAVMRAALAAHLTLEDLDNIAGTGFHGRVTEADVQHHRPLEPSHRPASGEAPGWLRPVVEETDQILAMSAVRKRIADHMIWSQRLSAQATAFADLDMSRIVALREKDVSYLTFFCIALVKLLKQYPNFNACVLDEGRVLHK